MSKTNTFSLYLAKAGVSNFEDLLTVSARDLVEKGTANVSKSAEFADGAVLYTFPGKPTVPKWLPLVRASFEVPATLTSQSPCALMMFKLEKSIFVVSFSYAHVYLSDAATEADFGLKVAVNAVSDGKLRSVEGSNIGAAIRDFAQAAGQRDLRSFGLDDALDLIRKVCGRASDDDFANMVTGARSLRFSKAIDLDEVPDVASEAVRLHGSKAYQSTGFKVIDFLSPVLDSALLARLDEALIDAVRSGSDEFEIAIPEIVPESIGTFRFEHAGISDFHPDLSIELYRDELGARLPSLSLQELKKHTVAAYAEHEDTSVQNWSIHRSLVGSLVLDAERYALNEGHWYRISQSLKDAADNTFRELCGKPDPKLRPFKQIYFPLKKGRKQKIGYQSEDSYNSEIAQEASYLLLDQRLIQIEETPGPGMEACDLLDLEGRRFIHIKKSSRQSSILSHFFKQGSNAARMFRQYEPFRGGLVAAIEKHYDRTTAQTFKAALKDKWTIDFQIADFPRADGLNNIPFFSKLTLREEARDIQAMGFDVGVNFIKLRKMK
jgi:uncharacterized protein (TIGR04141 family)